MAALKFPQKLPASTVLEVVLAMVILVIVFGLAMMIFTNVTASSPALKKTRAAAEIYSVLSAQSNQPPADTSFTSSNLTIRLHSEPYPGNARLLQVSVTAFDENQQVLASQQQLFVKP